MNAFERDYVVRISDINYGGHMGNEVALLVFQDARIAFLKTLGFGERDVGDGLGLILVEATVRYAREVFLEDRLATRVTADAIRRSSFDLVYEVRREADGEEVFSGRTRLLPFDYGARKVRPLPDALRAGIEALRRA